MKNPLLISVALLVLVLVFIFQRFNYAEALTSFLPLAFRIENANAIFVINRTIRLILNDLACMALIYALFGKRHYLLLAFYVFLIELFFLLPLYFVIKLTLEGDTELSSPLLSHLHRLIVNPLLMLLLMAGLLYQRIRAKNA
jgi:hypothetical protein